MPIQLTDDISKRLRAARKAMGFKSAKEFANQHHIPLSTYSQHETGKRSINAELIINYSTCFQISPCWLLTGYGEPFLDGDQKNRKVILEREMFSISPKIYEHEKEYTTPELGLLKKILLAAQPLFEDQTVKRPYEELIDHCFKIYDTVSSLPAQAKKDEIIQLTLSTMRG